MASVTPTPRNTPLTCSPVSPPWLPVYAEVCASKRNAGGNTNENTDYYAAARFVAGLGQSAESKGDESPMYELHLPPLALTRQRNLESAVRSMRLDTVYPKAYV